MSTQHIAIIGVGMAGIACARTLRQAGHHVSLFEKSRGLGGGFLPQSLAQPYLDSGLLVQKRVARPRRTLTHCAWREGPQNPVGHALRWWLDQLALQRTRAALLQPAHRV